MLKAIVAAVDSHASDPAEGLSPEQANRIDWLRIWPYILIHLACLLVLVVGTSWWAVGLCVGLYAVRMFGITGGYHRYFSHRTYKIHRVSQFLLAYLANTTAQRGPLWWAAHHRHHHRHSDDPTDSHSPKQMGVLKAHTTWFLTPGAFRTRTELVKDLMKFPELVLLDRFDWFAPLSQVAMCAFLGFAMNTWMGIEGVGAAQFAVWWCISTILVMHGTYTINSVCHIFGTKVYESGDDSKNCWWAAILTLGEGWHNNHHYAQHYAQHSHRWWQYDPTFWVLWCGEKVGLVWGMKRIPDRLSKSPDDGAAPAEILGGTPEPA